MSAAMGAMTLRGTLGGGGRAISAEIRSRLKAVNRRTECSEMKLVMTPPNYEYESMEGSAY